MLLAWGGAAAVRRQSPLQAASPCPGSTTSRARPPRQHLLPRNCSQGRFSSVHKLRKKGVKNLPHHLGSKAIPFEATSPLLVSLPSLCGSTGDLNDGWDADHLGQRECTLTALQPCHRGSAPTLHPPQVARCCLGNRLCVSGPAQFTPMLFQGWLSFRANPRLCGLSSATLTTVPLARVKRAQAFWGPIRLEAHPSGGPSQVCVGFSC